MNLIDRAADLIHALYHALDDTAQHMGGPDCKCHESEAYVMDKDVGDKLNAAFSEFTDGDEDGHEAVAALRQLAADHVALTLSRDEALADLGKMREEWTSWIPSDAVLTFVISISREGHIHNRTQTHGSSFADAYRGFHKIKAEVQRQIDERRNCPFNPMHGVAIEDVERGLQSADDLQSQLLASQQALKEARAKAIEALGVVVRIYDADADCDIKYGLPTFRHEPNCPYLTAAGGMGQCICTPEYKEKKTLLDQIAALTLSRDEALADLGKMREENTDLVGQLEGAAASLSNMEVELGDLQSQLLASQQALKEERAKAIEECAAIVEHPNAGLVPPDGGDPSPREMLDNIARTIRGMVR